MNSEPREHQVADCFVKRYSSFLFLARDFRVPFRGDGWPTVPPAFHAILHLNPLPLLAVRVSQNHLITLSFSWPVWLLTQSWITSPHRSSEYFSYSSTHPHLSFQQIHAIKLVSMFNLPYSVAMRANLHASIVVSSDQFSTLVISQIDTGNLPPFSSNNRQTIPEDVRRARHIKLDLQEFSRLYRMYFLNDRTADCGESHASQNRSTCDSQYCGENPLPRISVRVSQHWETPFVD